MGERRLAHCGKGMAATNSYFDFFDERSVLIITHAPKMTSDSCRIIQCANDVTDADLEALCHSLLTDIWVDQSNRETAVSASKLVLLARPAKKTPCNLYLFYGKNANALVPKAVTKVDKFKTEHISVIAFGFPSNKDRFTIARIMRSYLHFGTSPPDIWSFRGITATPLGTHFEVILKTWMKALDTDPHRVEYACELKGGTTAAYLGTEAARLMRERGAVVGAQSSRVPVGTEQVTRVVDSLQGMATSHVGWLREGSQRVPDHAGYQYQTIDKHNTHQTQDGAQA